MLSIGYFKICYVLNNPNCGRVATAYHWQTLRNGPNVCCNQHVIEIRQCSQTVASSSLLLCGCERRSFRAVTVEHPTGSIITNSFCVNNDLGRFIAIFIGIFLVISACSFNVLEILCISESEREQLRNQQHLFHNLNDQ